MRLQTQLSVGFVLVLSALVGGSCAPSADEGKPAKVTRTGPQHSVQTPALAALMKVIAMTAADYTPKTLPGDVESHRSPADMEKAYSQAAILADALVTAADRIPFAVQDKSMTQTTREGFLAEAAILKQSAMDLKEQASQKKGEAMTRSLDRINATCITCHSKYRDLTGTLDAPRADAWHFDRLPVAKQD